MTSVIARVPLVNLDDVEPAMAPLLERTKAASGGRLMNIHRQMATAPAVLAGYMGLRDALAVHAMLDGRTRAAISMACSGADHGEYTLAINSRLATREGWSDRGIATISQGRSTDDPKLDALLTVVREATSSDGRVADGTWSAAQAAGWSDGELAETFAYVGLVTYCDRFVRYAATELDVVAAVPITAG
jgi:hypothetical protein